MSHPPTTLITGAGKRIGAAIAQHLAGRGHELVLHYNGSQAEAEALATQLPTKVTLLQADLADTENLPAFWAGLPPVTHLVHNAASFAREPFAQFTPQQLRRHLAINLEAPLILSQGFLQQLPEGVQGSITVLGDGAMGWSISPNFFPYAVSKHAWTSVIDLLATSLAPRARANLVTLGPTLPGALDGPDTFATLAAAMPLKRTGSPEEVCHVVAQLIASPGITGQIISLANGMGLPSFRPQS